MKFSKAFGLKKTQSELDFVDVDPKRDLPLYVDPFAIELCGDSFSDRCNSILRQFFQALIDAIRDNNRVRVVQLMSNLGEPGDTFLGVSKGEPQGRGVGPVQGRQIVEALSKSAAAKSGKLHDLSESTLFIPHIGRDKISDLTTNLIRSVLVDYTHQQCALHGITALKKRPADKPLWNSEKAKWGSAYVELPVVGSKPVLLVPKHFVRRQISLESRDLYERIVVEFLQEEHTRPGDSLVQALKSGELYVTKKDVKKKYPFSKEFLFEFLQHRPFLLARYKSIKRATAPPTAGDLDEGFQESSHAHTLATLLNDIASGNDQASDYHSLMVGIVTFLFHPSLVNPEKEAEINEGRKRIDILCTNTGDGEFFQRVMMMPTGHAAMVPIECKNYGREIGNPEIDQLLGRFSYTRGKVGFLFCRRLADRELAIARCRDAARAGQGHVVIFEDQDVLELLEMIGELRRSQIQQRLNLRLNELLT